ncbi:hypothetical protein SteCoe_29042 [Stentor coeruleus]|uniref:Autophagy-related protein 13 N-terminal domain-containing protein n=1 Tax=Stentor coeruleus TaxID=5963 RepID=A0A1R2B6V6_9CILI|nr:hypothetical protein SteCoe_29042 [Stentor coeruleus]
MEKQADLKAFTAKFIDFLFYQHGSQMRHNETTDTSFEIKTPFYSHVHTEVDFIWEEKDKGKGFSVEVFHENENCNPLLLERWNFQISKLQNKSQKGAYSKFAAAFRELSSKCKSLPSSCIFTKSIYLRDSHLNTPWPSSLSNNEILLFPTVPYKLESLGFLLEVSVNYYIRPIQPLINLQLLGERPRLMSVGSIETQESPHFRRYSYAESKNKVLTTITNEAIYEENEVGIKLISSEIVEDEDFDNEDFGRSSFDMEFDISLTEDTPEEAKISLYMLNCDKIRELLLFK